jgi:hypothetical protein
VWVTFLQALNVLMLKILENSNRNYTFSALLVLLIDTPTELMAGSATAGGAEPTQMQQARWADLVVKCLIKSTKALPQVIEVSLLQAAFVVAAAGSMLQDLRGRALNSLPTDCVMLSPCADHRPVLPAAGHPRLL